MPKYLRIPTTVFRCHSISQFDIAAATGAWITGKVFNTYYFIGLLTYHVGCNNNSPSDSCASDLSYGALVADDALDCMSDWT